MKVTSSGYVLEFTYVLDKLRATAAQCKNPAHFNFVTTAITAFEEEGPDAEPLLNGCPQRAARLIFEEVTQAYITTEQATRIQARDSTLARDFQLPYTSHRRAQARRTEHEHRIRNVTGPDLLRHLRPPGLARLDSARGSVGPAGRTLPHRSSPPRCGRAPGRRAAPIPLTLGRPGPPFFLAGRPGPPAPRAPPPPVTPRRGRIVPERFVTMPGSTDQFVLTERPAPTPAHRYRPLPDGMDHTHLTVVPAHQVRTGDVVTAFFTDGPGTRYAEHAPEAFTAHPRPLGTCPKECQECEDTDTYDVTPDRYVCLDTADDHRDCVIVFRNAPVAIIPADVAADFPPLDSVPPLPDLFTLDEEEIGPYEALPVPRTWIPFATISVTRTTAERIATNLPTTHAGRHLTFRWLGDALLIDSDLHLPAEPGRPIRLIEPDTDGHYRIGGLWAWEEWSVPSCPDCSTETEPVNVEGERVWRCTAPDCNRRTYGTGDPDDDELPPYTETDEGGATIAYHGSGEVDIEATAELAAQDYEEDDDDLTDECPHPECDGYAVNDRCTNVDCSTHATGVDEEADEDDGDFWDEIMPVNVTSWNDL
ncbi:hypothetical protein ACIQGT_25885 [Streptomyces sp. NPDC093108]|uniref:hypothetical protein n=1 Tax=Streptomyces sp. NPDC093108 TaxID=3366030 RepID=UPI0037FEC5F8